MVFNCIFSVCSNFFIVFLIFSWSSLAFLLYFCCCFAVFCSICAVEARESLSSWFPPDSGIIEKVEAIRVEFPNGFDILREAGQIHNIIKFI